MSYHDGLKPMALFNPESSVSPQRRAIQAVLASLPAIPALAEHLLEGHGPRRTRLVKFSPLTRAAPRAEDWTPDAAIFISNSSSSWLGLVANTDEAGEFDAALEAVRAGKADCVISVSPGAGHPERAAGLPVIDWTIASLRSACEITAHQHQSQSPAEALILRDLITLLNDPCVSGSVLDPVTADAWARVLQGKGAVDMRQIGEQIAAELSRAIAQELTIQRRGDKDAFGVVIPIRGAAADLGLQIDAEQRRISASMTLSAGRMGRPLHEVITWLTSQLQTRDERALVTITRSSGAVLTLTPEAVQAYRAPAGGMEDPVDHVEVRMNMDLGDDLQDGDLTVAALLELALDFYGEIGQNMEAWRPAPPRLIRPRGPAQPVAVARKAPAAPAAPVAVVTAEAPVGAEAVETNPIDTPVDASVEDAAPDPVADAVVEPSPVVDDAPVVDVAPVEEVAETAPATEMDVTETDVIKGDLAAIELEPELEAEPDATPHAADLSEEQFAAAIDDLAEGVMGDAVEPAATPADPVWAALSGFEKIAARFGNETYFAPPRRRENDRSGATRSDGNETTDADATALVTGDDAGSAEFNAVLDDLVDEVMDATFATDVDVTIAEEPEATAKAETAEEPAAEVATEAVSPAEPAAQSMVEIAPAKETPAPAAVSPISMDELLSEIGDLDEADLFPA